MQQAERFHVAPSPRLVASTMNAGAREVIRMNRSVTSQLDCAQVTSSARVVRNRLVFQSSPLTIFLRTLASISSEITSFFCTSLDCNCETVETARRQP